jgi:hypothetical protein
MLGGSLILLQPPVLGFFFNLKIEEMKPWF